MPGQLTSLRSVLDFVAVLAVIGAAGTYMWGRLVPPDRTTTEQTDGQRGEPPPIPLPAEALSLDGAPQLGDNGAPVVMVVFSDFECPYCAKFAREVLPVLRERYIDTGRLRLAYRHFPLVRIHPKAIAAAEAAECASQQNAFWPMHDRLFADPSRLGIPDLRKRAEELGMDVGLFNRCLAEEAPLRVRADSELARGLQLVGTPTSLIGSVLPDGRVSVKRILRGTRSVPEFSEAVESLLRPL